MKSKASFIVLVIALILLIGCTGKNNLIKGIRINFDKTLNANVDTKIPVSVPVEENVSARVKSIVPVNVPVKQTIDVPLKQTLDVKIKKQMSIPVDQDINVNAVIPVDIVVPIDTIVTTTINLPLVGNVNIDIPVKADVPVRVNIPISNQKVHVADNIEFLLDDNVPASLNALIKVPIDTEISANAEIDDVFYVPVKLTVDSIIPISQKIPVRINQTLSIESGDITLIR